MHPTATLPTRALVVSASRKYNLETRRTATGATRRLWNAATTTAAAAAAAFLDYGQKSKQGGTSIINPPLFADAAAGNTEAAPPAAPVNTVSIAFNTTTVVLRQEGQRDILGGVRPPASSSGKGHR